MPFSAAMTIGGAGRNITLAKLDAEDLAMLYDVEAQIALQFPALGASQAKDIINLTLGGHDYVAAVASSYAIDADGIHNEAKLVLTFELGCHIYGRGGIGGRGGYGDFEISNDGQDGFNGGTAIRLGCPTDMLGICNVQAGYGGGGGSAGSQAVNGGGNGGGGGAAFGSGGAGFYQNGVAGSVATLSLGGDGGSSNNGGNGGNGGSESFSAQRGQNMSGSLGGEAGLNGNAMDAQAFVYNADPGINFIGAVI